MVQKSCTKKKGRSGGLFHHYMQEFYFVIVGYFNYPQMVGSVDGSEIARSSCDRIKS